MDVPSATNITNHPDGTNFTVAAFPQTVEITQESTSERVVDEALIREITRTIVDAFHPCRVILFGSRARGDYRQDSDIDLLVEMESTEPRWKRRLMVNSLFQNQWWPMDVLVYTPEEYDARKNGLATVIPYVEREGKLLYERGF
jgi:predicted nucleotidyltransferase